MRHGAPVGRDRHGSLPSSKGFRFRGCSRPRHGRPRHSFARRTAAPGRAVVKPFRPGRRAFALPLALAAVLLIRLLSLGAYPLTDTSEARFGEIVRKMVVLQDWVTPWYHSGVPYWGKPPLAFWLSALSTQLFGMNEFALRLPSFLLGLGMLALIAVLARREEGAATAWNAALVLASSLLFFIVSGAMLTDAALAFSLTLAMVAFWRGVAAPGRDAAYWRYLLFLALGLGLLAKGPVALVLSGAPVALWALFSRRVFSSLRALPWAGGLALTLALAAPWYALAEQHTPGFLQYFLVGENFRRFTDPHWAGILYGNLHNEPHGFVWLLLLGATLPWSLLWLVLVVPALRRGIGNAWAGARDFFRTSSWRLYLLCFALVPPLFFTFASSVLPTYLLPPMPALALLLASWWQQRRPQASPRGLVAAALALPLLCALGLPLFNARLAADRSQQQLLAQLPPRAAVVYFPRRPFSAEFYSQGRAREAKTAAQLQAAVATQPAAYVVTYAASQVPDLLRSRYRAVAASGHQRRAVLWAPAR